MKVFCISDLHLSTVVEKPMDIFGPGWDNHFERICDDWNKKVAENDVVLISGDISWGMYMEEAIPDLDVISKLPGKIVLLRGNHDYWWKSISVVRRALKENMFAIQNDSLRIGNLLLCGTRGWTVPEIKSKTEEDEKIYQREILRLELSLKQMSENRKPTDTVVGMMHYPPFNSKYQISPFMELFKKYDVDKVVYGHLHGKQCRTEKVVQIDGVTYFLTSCDQVDCKLTLIAEVEDAV